MRDTTTGLPLAPQEMEDARAYHRQREARRAAEREAERLAWLARVYTAVAEVAPQHGGVRRVYLYGSLVQEGRFRADSDIDLAVVCTDLKTESAFGRDLERRLRREVDMRPLAEPIAPAVQRYGVIVYERESDPPDR